MRGCAVGSLPAGPGCSTPWPGRSALGPARGEPYWLFRDAEDLGFLLALNAGYALDKNLRGQQQQKVICKLVQV